LAKSSANVWPSGGTAAAVGPVRGAVSHVAVADVIRPRSLADLTACVQIWLTAASKSTLRTLRVIWTTISAFGLLRASAMPSKMSTKYEL
jgi:hypothetical protein